MRTAGSELAGLVDLSPGDIDAVFLPSAASDGTGGDATLIQATVQQAQAAMEQIQAQTSSQRWQQALACAAPLQAAVGALQDQCLQLAGALGASGQAF